MRRSAAPTAPAGTEPAQAPKYRIERASDGRLVQVLADDEEEEAQEEAVFLPFRRLAEQPASSKRS